MILLVWPAVTVASALLGMLVGWSFSWSELALDYLVGMVLGACFMAGTDADAEGVAKFVLVFSHGLFGALHLAEVEPFVDREALFYWCAIGTLVATLLSGLLDRAAMAIGKGFSVGGLVFSLLLIWPLKAPWALFTTGVGMVLFLIGCVRAIIAAARKKETDPRASARVGNNAGLFYTEWDTSPGGKHATTLGATINVWHGTIGDVIEHETFHSRQAIYLRDWFVPTWVIGGIWGLISYRIWVAGDPKNRTFNWNSFLAARHDVEAGNPMERAAYRRDGKSPF